MMRSHSQEDSRLHVLLVSLSMTDTLAGSARLVPEPGALRDLAMHHSLNRPTSEGEETSSLSYILLV